MAEFKEKHFSIEPGKGKKMDGCPYSTYEDGRDVKDYIIPPKGYVFKCFRFDPDARNQIYDGRLIAEYEKETFNDRMKTNLWKVMLALAIVAIITVIAILAAGVFKDPKTSKQRADQQLVATANDLTDPTSPDVTIIPATTPDNPTTPVQEDEEVTLTSEGDSVSEEVAPQHSDDPNIQFQNEFWALVHQRTLTMDPYDILFKDNKGKVQGEEYDYLRLVILKDFNAFKEWSNKLRSIPVSDLETINTVADLKKKINPNE